MPPAFKPSGKTAQNAARSVREKAEQIVRLKHPGAVVWRVICDEALFPILLFSVAAVDGVAEAARAVMLTPLDAKDPDFETRSGWDVEDDY